MAKTRAHGGIGDGRLPPELGLNLLSSKSLIEFEDGSSMLSREILVEMLSTNEKGILNERGEPVGKRQRRARRRERQGGTTMEWTRESDRGAVDDGKRTHWVCQENTPSRHGESSSVTSRAGLSWRSYAASRLERSNSIGNMDVGGDRKQQRLLCSALLKAKNAAGTWVPPSCAVPDPTVASPSKRGRSSPVKLYDHDHNPRLLRALVDETALTNITERPVVGVKEGTKGVVGFVARIPPAHHHATDSEVKMSKSQLDVSLREPLGELRLDRSQNTLAPEGEESVRDALIRPLGARGGDIPNITVMYRGEQERTVGRDWSRRRRSCFNEHVHYQHHHAISRLLKAQKQATSPSHSHTSENSFVSCIKRPNDQLFPKQLGRRSIVMQCDQGDSPRVLQISEVPKTCNPLLSTSLNPISVVPTGSNLSFLRPFSAGGVRSAWKLEGVTRVSDSPGPRGLSCTMTTEEHGLEWPVLFVVGGGGCSGPPARHPLSVHALPSFDDDTIALLAGASGEPEETVRLMARVLSEFEFCLLQEAVKRLCCVDTTPVAGSTTPSAFGSQQERQHCPAAIPTQAWVTGSDESTAARRSRRSEDGANSDQPLMLSKEQATRVMTSGFLGGIFGDDTIRDILRASRPVVVYDSVNGQQGADSTTTPPPLRENTATRREEGVMQHSMTRRPSHIIAAAANTVIASVLLSGVDRAVANVVSNSEMNGSKLKFSIPPAERAPLEALGTRARTGPEAAENEYVLVSQLVQAIATKFRIYTLAVRHSGDGSGYSSGVVRAPKIVPGRMIDKDRSLRAPGKDNVCLENRCPGSAGCNDLVLPPLKFLLKRNERKRRPRGTMPGRSPASTAWRDEIKYDLRGATGLENGVRKGGWTMGEEVGEEDEVLSGVERPRSTPRCLRRGLEGQATISTLRRELEVAETKAARLGVSMARKAEVWRIEARSSEEISLASRAAVATSTISLGTNCARKALLDVVQGRTLKAAGVIYCAALRRSWNTWVNLTRHHRSLEAAKLVVRLVATAALGFSVLTPLLRRRKLWWLRRWVTVTRAERILEVHTAAVNLQRIVREFLGRKRSQRRKRDTAAITVQRVWRGRAGRARSARRASLLRKHRAVRAVERGRFELIRRRDAILVKERKRKDRAATKIQSAWRTLVLGRRPAMLLRRARREESSAIMVQRLWRGVLARGKADTLLEAKRMREAATRIQAIVRGRGVRRSHNIPIMLRERAAASRLCNFWRCKTTRKRARLERARLHLARVANPLARGFLSRVSTRKIREERRKTNWLITSACVVAQKMFRGKQGRRKARIELQRLNGGTIAGRDHRKGEEQASVEPEPTANVDESGGTAPASAAAPEVVSALKRDESGVCGAEATARLTHVEAGGVHNQNGPVDVRHETSRCAREARGGIEVGSTQDGDAEGAADSGTCTVGAFKPQTDTFNGGGKITKSSLVLDDTGELVDIDSAMPVKGRAAETSTVPTVTALSPAENTSQRNEDKIPSEETQVLAEVHSQQSVTAFDAVMSGEGHSAEPPLALIPTSALSLPGQKTPESNEHKILPSEIPVSAETPSPQPVNAIDAAMPTLSTPVEKMPQPGENCASLGEEEQILDEVPPQQLVVAPEEGVPAYYRAKLRYLMEQESAHGASVAEIQAVFRGFVARRVAREVREKNREAERRHLERARAAVVIQSGARGRAARLEVAHKRAAMLEAARREERLPTIQRAVRCYLARCRLWHLKEAERARVDMVHRMATRIQARARGWKARHVWRKFSKNRTLLDRERRRKGARQIQSRWRSTLARTETMRRKNKRDAAKMEKEMEIRVESVMEPTMERERENAYAVRIQCWWRRMLAMKTKTRETPDLAGEVQERAERDREKATLVIQRQWRGYRARCFYHENYESLFRERERKRYCTECLREYATRKCGTCLDKFCEVCWARMHSNGARRFHHWEPVASLSHTTNGQPDIPVGMPASVTGTNDYYYGYFPEGTTQAEDGRNEEQHAQQQDTDGRLWTANQQQAVENNRGYSNHDEGLNPESDSSNRKEELKTKSHGRDRQQEWQGWTHPGSLESEQARQDLNPTPSLNDDYRGAASYDVPTGSYQPWSSEASNTPNNDWGAEGPYRWGEDTQEAAGYFYGNDGGAASLQEMSATDQGLVTTPLEAADDSSRVGSKMNESGGKDGWDAREFDGGLSSWEVAGGESWTYNEYGQRVWGDWVEYFDESAQATYFYNTVTGEASWTEPAK